MENYKVLNKMSPGWLHLNRNTAHYSNIKGPKGHKPMDLNGPNTAGHKGLTKSGPKIHKFYPLATLNKIIQMLITKQAMRLRQSTYFKY